MEQLFDGLVRMAHIVAPHLINAAWLGLALAALLAATLRYSSWGNAATRYAFAWGVLIVIVALPGILALGHSVSQELHAQKLEQTVAVSPSEPAASADPVVQSSSTDLKRVIAEGRVGAFLPARAQTSQPLVWAPVADRSVAAAPPTPMEKASLGQVALSMIPPIALSLIIMIVGYLLFRLAMAMGHLVATVFVSEPAPKHIRERADYWAERISCSRSLSVRVSDRVQSPTATGYFKGIVLLPPRVTEEFSPCDIDVVLLHEISHVKRYDDWARLGEYLLAALFFCLPAVHWMIRQIDLQREIACDDLVLSQTGRPQEYARTLTRLAEMSVGARRIELAPGAMITKKQIFARFTMILSGNTRRDNRLATRGLTTAFTVLAAVVLLVGQQLPAVVLPGEAITFADISEAIFDRNAPKEPIPAPPEESIDTQNDGDRWLRAFPNGAGTEPSYLHYEKAVAAPRVFKTPELIASDFGAKVAAIDRGAAAFDRFDVADLADLADLADEGGPVMEALEGAVKRVGNSLRDLGNWEGSMIDIDDDGSRGSYEYRKNGHMYRLEFDGAMKLNDDLTAVVAVEDGGYVELEERDRGGRTRLMIESDRSGTLEYTYWVDGHEEDFDADGHKWFADALSFTVRASGIGAEKRVEKLRKEDGVQAVLDEIEELPGGYARSRYYGALLEGPSMSADERRSVFTHAGRWMDSDYSLAEFLIKAADNGKIDRDMMPDVVRALDGMDSNYELRRVLTAIGVGDNTDPALAAEVLKIADRMDSNYERAELLIEMAPNIGDDQALLDAYVEAVVGLESDYETRRVLTALGLGDRIDNKLAASILPIASRMDSDYEKVELLLDLAETAQTDDELMQMYLDVASSLDSDYELRRALTSMRPELGTREETIEQYISLADQISSDYERSEFLIGLAGMCQGSEKSRLAYLRATDDISSDYEKSRVLKALIVRGEDDPKFLSNMIEAVGTMNSDFEKANLLRELVEPCARFKELEDPFVGAIESLSGDFERDKLYREFYRELRRLQ